MVYCTSLTEIFSKYLKGRTYFLNYQALVKHLEHFYSHTLCKHSWASDLGSTSTSKTTEFGNLTKHHMFLATPIIFSNMYSTKMAKFYKCDAIIIAVKNSLIIALVQHSFSVCKNCSQSAQMREISWTCLTSGLLCHHQPMAKQVLDAVANQCV